MSEDSRTPYGYCPTCGSLGKTRERRPDGDDECENGHKYPSRTRLLHPGDSHFIPGTDMPRRPSLQWHLLEAQRLGLIE